MDCIFDSCLACDRQTMGTLYCSQACRSADFGRAAALHSTITYQVPSNDRSNCMSTTATPTEDKDAFVFDYNRRQRGSTCSSVQSSYTSPTSPMSTISTSSRTPSEGGYVIRRQTILGIPDVAKKELQSYLNSFDHARESRRRSCPSIHKHHGDA